MGKLRHEFNIKQIGALLKKDILVRIRQPWMTLVQLIWPFMIFMALYSLRSRFQAIEISDCQFPTRLLPAKHNILPFFHSYICTLENACKSPAEYEEYSTFDEAPLKPILNIVETFLNDDTLYNTLVTLPEKGNFVTAVLSVATHKKFKYMEENIGKVVASVPKVEKMLGGSFDITSLFSDDATFSNAGKLICGRPFPRSDNIRFVQKIIYSEDYNEANDEELKYMPTKYCKQLYLDVTRSNSGKMTWNHIKPIIQGKIIYGPNNKDTMEIIKYANSTFEDMAKLRTLTASVDTIMTKLRNDTTFKKSFDSLLDLIKSPLVKAVAGSIDINLVEAVMNRIATDPVIADIFRTVNNILECFSVDRFIPTDSDKALEQEAFDLDHKKLFYAGVYFSQTAEKEIEYKIRMDPDNTPITSEIMNRFWFPGPDASFVLDHRYHRGFVQIKHSLDMGIIRYKKIKKSQQPLNESSTNFVNLTFNGDSSPVEKMSTTEDPFWNSDFDDDVDDNIDDDDDDSTKNSTESSSFEKFYTNYPTSESQNDSSSLEDFLNFKDESDNGEEMDSEDLNNDTETESKNRTRRSPQSGLLSLLFGGGGASKPKVEELKFSIDDMQIYTKQFPYPKYTKDTFKKGIYLAQSIQMAFFIALIVQVATCVRFRIWMKESKNTMVMRSMGLKATSEILTWIITTFIEILIVFLIACIILYSGGLIKYTGFFFLLSFLLLFGMCVISFCYMCSTFFSSASIGSVSSSILFLMTFLPYIIIISLRATLSEFFKFLANLSMSTAFCYAWSHIMRLELQDVGMSFYEAFAEDADEDFRYAYFMMFLDMFVYALVGFFVERIKNDEFKFHTVAREELDTNISAILQNVSKIYNTTKVAVSNISLVIPKNHITCLLGRNGSGKSTIIKMLTGQIRPTNGKIVLSQLLPDKYSTDKVGFCSQDNVLIPHLTAKEHLELYARLKLHGDFDMEVTRTMNDLKFGKYENFEAYKLSGGYKRRLCVAIAFIGSPSLVILDEPCSGVDTKARKCVWELIETLRKGRAVVLATHYLDEAEYLSDSVSILSEGRVINQHTPDSLKEIFSKSFDISITIEESNQNKIVEDIKMNARTFVENFEIHELTGNNLKLSIPYNGTDLKSNKCAELVEYLENLQRNEEIKQFSVTSKNLEEFFNNLHSEKELVNGNGNIDGQYEKIDLSRKEHFTNPDISNTEIIQQLLKKRFLHFRRNYKLLMCILLLPALFQIIAMAFLQLRPEGDYDAQLDLSRELYFGAKEFFSVENPTNFTNETVAEIKKDCFNCIEFDNSENVFKWILDTYNEYKGNRYGGLTFNESRAIVWYNNKGYHSMVSWLNDLNMKMLRAELKDRDYSISTINHPISLGDKSLSESSILQQVADAGVALILLIAFSLVTAGASVFITNERVSGEKLQQKLCGVDFKTYWGVAFVWDLVIYSIALVTCVIIFVSFNIPLYMEKQNLDGICLLLFLYGFASIPVVHTFEKLFMESSIAYMTIFCMNVIIALTTLAVILLIDILGTSDSSERWRNFFDAIFLVFPQYALSDGLIEVCKNSIVATFFIRFDINTYKSPISSSLVRRNYLSLFIMGLIFMGINYAIESGYARSIIKKILRRHRPKHDLHIVTIQNSLKRDDKYSSYGENYAIRVENIYKSYKGNDYAVKDVTFDVKSGECFGLLGNNGAGKSTIFGILSGQMDQTSGNVKFFNKQISYCPQTSALDPLLTVLEVIQFYGRLRRITDIKKLTATTLRSFHLDDYKDVLVKDLSGGNRRKLTVAIACFGDTSVVLMDEPTSDMDPVTRSLVYEAINELVSEQRSVLMTSHTISEIDRVCHRIGVLKDGSLIKVGTPSQLEEQCGGYYIVTIFYDKIEALTMEREVYIAFPQCRDMQIHPHSLKFLIKIILKQNGDENNEIVEDDGSLNLSEVLSKLAQFCGERNIKYTVTKCQLDKIFETILDSADGGGGGYIHKSFVQSETVT